MIDMATHYHIAARVGQGGTPSSRVCAEALNQCWFTPFGAPKRFVSDQGVHNKGRVYAMLKRHGVEVRSIGAQAPYQLGTAERHGGILKQVMYKAIHSRQLEGAVDISALCAEASRTKNTLVNNGGYSPIQWVLGFTPDDLTSLISHDVEGALGVHQELVEEEQETSQEVFMRQLLIRQCAKEAFIHVDTSMKIRKAMLRRATTLRGPYRTGDLVCFSRRGKWYGPARVLAPEGKSSLWLVHSGVTVLVSETACRPASGEEVMKKHALEMRPSRKRRRELLSDSMEEEDYLPFTEDGQQARSLRARIEVQTPFVDVNQNPPLAQLPNAAPGMAAIPGNVSEPYSPTEAIDTPRLEPDAEMPTEAPAVATDSEMPDDAPGPTPPPGLEEIADQPSTSVMSGQPESEVTPVMSQQTSEVTSEEETIQPDRPEATTTQLTQALRQGADRLDGVPRARLTGQDGSMNSHEINYVQDKVDRFLAFAATRQHSKVKKNQKKAKKAGAGRELVYEKESEEMKQKLIETRRKEWANWTKYSDGVWIDEKQLKELQSKQPSLKVIPTRWVEVDKSEVGQKEQLKSRLVVRGDLKDSSRMRTDSPTCSLTATSLALALAACRDTDLWGGDISAAFLQGSKLNRILVLAQPKSGIPDVEPGMYFLVSSTVYGTKDAPRGWFKNLYQTMLQFGFRPMPHEAAACVLNGSDGRLEGIAIVHVDDLLWTGGPVIEKTMESVCQHYRFGKIEKNHFKYCGREISKDEKGIHVTCPHLVDRVRPVYLTADQRKDKDGKVTEEVRGQLRSVIGSLAWLVRVCRPDLAYAISKMQADVHQATYKDVVFANGILNLARKSKHVGVTYPLKAFKFEEAMIVGVSDASFSNDFDVSESGEKMGFRSQSGRIICLGHQSFQHDHKGQLMLMEWHSTTIKRVCRSTLQAETISLLHCAELTEHLRIVFHGLWHKHDQRDRKWLVTAQDMIPANWYTDCKSLEQHVNQAGTHVVTDKRLAIDLCGLRQQVWRQGGEEVGDPLLTDFLPENRTTKLTWIPTEKMPGHPAEGETRQESPSTAATGDGTLLSSGIHQGKMYAWVYQDETAYTKMLISKNQNDRLRDPHLISYALYAEDRKRRGGTNTAFMSQLLEETEEEDYMLAVLDTGCDNTCHGDNWMEKYQRLIGRELEAEPADGRFKGVGGKVEVACKRIIPMQMLTVDQEKIPGSIASVELQSSDTPLLLSIHAQRTLGLILDLQNNTAYSKYLDKELQLHGHNGLPAIRLHPGEFQVGSVAMHVQESEGSEEKTRPKVIDLEAMDDHISEEGEEEPVEVSGKEVEAGYERHLPLAEESIKVLSKGQKKQLQESLDEMDHQDSALWSTLASKPRQPKKMLPKGCRTFLMELFAGTATLTLMAAQMGLPVSEPIDVLYDGKYDLLKRENRERISWQIEQDDPYLLSMTPICGPRSSWQYVNMARGGETAEHILEQRKQWYPVIRWLCDVVKKRLAKGREVVWENPWGSLMWYLRCVEQLMEAQITNALTFEPLEILRMDQCMYGLVDPRTGIPYRKATGLMLPSRHMKEELSELCDGSHIHQPLEGNLTKQAEHWPEELCHRVLRGAMRELQSQALSMAFPVEQVAEEREEVGCLDAIHDSRDLEESPMKKQKIDHDEIQREEIFEEMTDEDKMLHQKERDRKAKWLKLNKEKRIALRRLHAMMGHCSVATMTRMLKSSLASKDLLDAVPHFRCQSCEERRREEAPRSVRPTRSKAELKFNYELAVMCLR